MQLHRKINFDFDRVLPAIDKARLVLAFNREVLSGNVRNSEIILLYPCFVGRASSGKSARARQLAKEMNMKLRTVILSQMLPEDIGGIPKVQDVVDKLVTKYSIPEWMEYDLVLFDELDKARESKLAPILSVMSERVLHGYKVSAQIVFGAQVAENSMNFLDLIKSQTETYEALARRLLLIPTPIEEAWERLIQKHNLKRVQIPKDPLTEKLMSYRLPLIYPAVAEYVIEFTKWLYNNLSHIVESPPSEDTKRIEMVKKIAGDVFYYWEDVDVIIQDVLSPDTGILESEKVALYERAIREPWNYPIDLVLRAVAYLSPQVKAKDFFLSFVWALARVSNDEANKLHEEIYNRVKETLNFTSDVEEEVAVWFLASWSALMIKIGRHEADSDIKVAVEIIKENFPDEVNEALNFININGESQ